jgi:hypothetical protein
MGKCSLSFDSNMAIDFAYHKALQENLLSAFGGHLLHLYVLLCNK